MIAINQNAKTYGELFIPAGFRSDYLSDQVMNYFEQMEQDIIEAGHQATERFQIAKMFNDLLPLADNSQEEAAIVFLIGRNSEILIRGLIKYGYVIA